MTSLIATLATAGASYGLAPQSVKDFVSNAVSAFMKNNPEATPLSFGSALATMQGVGWNCIIMPVEGGLAAAAHFYAIRHLLNRFIAPEPGSVRDVALYALSFVGSAFAGYEVAESINYSTVPHLNPGYDTRWISVIGSTAGAVATTVYIYQTRKPIPPPEPIAPPPPPPPPPMDTWRDYAYKLSNTVYKKVYYDSGRSV